MDKENTTQAESKTESIQHISGAPPHRRRKHSKRKRSKIKKYFEWLIWATVAIGFFYLLYTLITSVNFGDKDAKAKKTSLLKVVTDGPVS